MKRLITIIFILISVQSIGQIVNASYTNKSTTTPVINSSSYKLNGVVKEFSQWVTSGSNISFSGGNVGIGKSPSYALDINGTINATALYKNGAVFSFNTNLTGNPTIDNAAGSQSLLYFRSGTSNRWAIGKSSEAESGSNAGSDFTLYRYNDAGSLINKPFVFVRSTGYLGINDDTPSYQLDVNGTSHFGTSSNYTSTEADGTIVLVGDATCYMDAIVNFIYKGGTGEATLDTYIGGIKQLKFLTNDFVALSNTEAPHDWDEGSAIELHLHWMVKNALIAGDKIRWQLEYAVSNIVANSNPNTIFCDPANPTVFGSRTVIVEYTAPVGGIPAGTHLYTTFETVTPTNLKIGAGFIGTLTRIAKTAGGTDPTTGSIFASNVGIHYKVNTIGSRTTSAK